MFHNVQKSFKEGTKALHDVNFTVQNGEFFKVHGFSFKQVETMDQGLRTRALETGEVDFMDAYSQMQIW